MVVLYEQESSVTHESEVLLKGSDFMYKLSFLLVCPDSAYSRFHDNEETIDN